MIKPKPKAKPKAKTKPKRKETAMPEKEKAKVSEFLASERKITDLSRQELADMLEDKGCPDFLKSHLSGELVRRITAG